LQIQKKISMVENTQKHHHDFYYKKLNKQSFSFC
jgi:hypothetical protein